MQQIPAEPKLSEADRLWLANTFAVNHSRFAGWSMEEPDDDAAAKAAADAATAKAAADKAAADKASGEKGFPANTPVSEMTTEQRAAYDAHKREEVRQAKQEWKDATGDRSAAQIKADLAELEELRRSKMSDNERAIADAKAEGRKSALAEIGPKAVESAFNLILPSDMPETEKAEILGVIDLNKFLTSDNEVDTAKVKAHAARIAPAKGQGSGRDFGQGRRGNSAPAGSVAAVKEARRQAREDKLKTS